jgi:hypothetical protein
MADEIAAFAMSKTRSTICSPCAVGLIEARRSSRPRALMIRRLWERAGHFLGQNFRKSWIGVGNNRQVENITIVEVRRAEAEFLDDDLFIRFDRNASVVDRFDGKARVGLKTCRKEVDLAVFEFEFEAVTGPLETLRYRSRCPILRRRKPFELPFLQEDVDIPGPRRIAITPPSPRVHWTTSSPIVDFLRASSSAGRASLKSRCEAWSSLKLSPLIEPNPGVMVGWEQPVSAYRELAVGDQLVDHEVD